MKKGLLLVCCITALVLSACGGKSNSASETSNDQNELAVSEEGKTMSDEKTEAKVSSEQVENNQTSIAEQEEDEKGRWTVQQETDEFGDATGDGENYLVTHTSQPETAKYELFIYSASYVR